MWNPVITDRDKLGRRSLVDASDEEEHLTLIVVNLVVACNTLDRQHLIDPRDTLDPRDLIDTHEMD